MTSMTSTSRSVIAGVDCHAETHTAVVLDTANGQRLGIASFPTSPAGYRAVRRWLVSFAALEAVGVESSGSYGAGLTRALRAHAVTVIEVNRPHAHTRRRRGKNDPVDAEATARKVLAGEAAGAAKDTTGIVEAIRQLRVARNSAVKARTAALVQLGELIVTAPAELREALKAAPALPGKAKLCRRLRPDLHRLAEPTQAAKCALRGLAGRIDDLNVEIAGYDAALAPLVATAAPRTSALRGIGTAHAGQLLVSAGQNITRLHSEAAFAHLCAAAPIEASSGKTTRHRLDRGGDRHANSTLYMIIVGRLGHCPRTKAYAQRRAAEGLNKKEIIRCLKRYLAREIYHALRADLADLANPPLTAT